MEIKQHVKAISGYWQAWLTPSPGRGAALCSTLCTGQGYLLFSNWGCKKAMVWGFLQQILNSHRMGNRPMEKNSCRPQNSAGLSSCLGIISHGLWENCLNIFPHLKNEANSYQHRRALIVKAVFITALTFVQMYAYPLSSPGPPSLCREKDLTVFHGSIRGGEHFFRPKSVCISLTSFSGHTKST